MVSPFRGRVCRIADRIVDPLAEVGVVSDERIALYDIGHGEHQEFTDERMYRAGEPRLGHYGQHQT